jgi:drug/metabolite transporter (DMT)-like permease
LDPLRSVGGVLREWPVFADVRIGFDLDEPAFYTRSAGLRLPERRSMPYPARRVEPASRASMTLARSSRWRDRSLSALAAAIGTMLLWSGTPIANKIALGHMDPATAGLLRSALAGIFAGALALIWKLPFPVNFRQRWLLAFSGIASFALWPLLLSVGLGMTTANHAALMIATIPAVTGVMAAVVDRVRPGLAWLVGVSIAMLGTVVLITVRAEGSATAVGSATGDVIILTGVIACAAGYVAGGKLAYAIGTWATTFWSLGVAAVALVPVLVWLSPRTDWAAVTSGEWLAVGYMTFCSSLVGYVLWFWALGHGGITRMSALQLGQPVFTVVFAVLLLGEAVTAPLVVAGSAVLAGTALTQIRRR